MPGAPVGAVPGHYCLDVGFHWLAHDLAKRRDFVTLADRCGVTLIGLIEQHEAVKGGAVKEGRVEHNAGPIAVWEHLVDRAVDRPTPGTILSVSGGHIVLVCDQQLLGRHLRKATILVGPSQPRHFGLNNQRNATEGQKNKKPFTHISPYQPVENAVNDLWDKGEEGVN